MHKAKGKASVVCPHPRGICSRSLLIFQHWCYFLSLNPRCPPTHHSLENPLAAASRLWVQAPVEGDFDGVAWLGFDHPGTAQGILVEARPAWRQDGATGRSQMTTAGSWGTEGREGAFLRGQMNKQIKTLYNMYLPTSIAFAFMGNYINYINCEFCLLGSL